MNERMREEERTGFQEGSPYGPKYDLQTDFVMVYGINESMPERIRKWKDRGYLVHLMPARIQSPAEPAGVAIGIGDGTVEPLPFEWDEATNTLLIRYVHRTGGVRITISNRMETRRSNEDENRLSTARSPLGDD